MKIKYSFVMLLGCTFLLLYGCSSGEVFENKEITGLVFYRDTLLETAVKIAPKASIYLQDSQDSTQFLYKVASDDNAVFSIPYKIKDYKEQYIRGLFTLNSINYTGQIPVKTNPDTLILSANYSGYYLKVKLKLKGDPLNNANVYLFTNQEYLKIANDTAVSEANVKNYVSLISTNERGVSLFTNQYVGSVSTRYYVLVRYTLGKIKKTYDSSFNITKVNSKNRLEIVLQ